MRIGIVGAGAIGCHVGGKLAAHADVVFVGRESQRAALAAGSRRRSSTEPPHKSSA